MNSFTPWGSANPLIRRVRRHASISTIYRAPMELGQLITPTNAIYPSSTSVVGTTQRTAQTGTLAAKPLVVGTLLPQQPSSREQSRIASKLPLATPIPATPTIPVQPAIQAQHHDEITTSTDVVDDFIPIAAETVQTDVGEDQATDALTELSPADQHFELLRNTWRAYHQQEEGSETNIVEAPRRSSNTNLPNASTAVQLQRENSIQRKVNVPAVPLEKAPRRERSYQVQRTSDGEYHTIAKTPPSKDTQQDVESNVGRDTVENGDALENSVRAEELSANTNASESENREQLVAESSTENESVSELSVLGSAPPIPESTSASYDQTPAQIALQENDQTAVTPFVGNIGEAFVSPDDVQPKRTETEVSENRNLHGGEFAHIENSAEAESSVSPPPLQDVWPIQRKPDGNVHKPHLVPNDEPVQPDPNDHATLGNVMRQVETAQPTGSTVHVMMPRRPRPKIIQPSQTEQAKSEDRVQRAIDKSKISLDANPQTDLPMSKKEAAESSHLADGKIEQQENDSETNDLVETEIGPLPSDLWQLIDEPVPSSESVSQPSASRAQSPVQRKAGQQVEQQVEQQTDHVEIEERHSKQMDRIESNDPASSEGASIVQPNGSQLTAINTNKIRDMQQAESSTELPHVELVEDLIDIAAAPENKVAPQLVDIERNETQQQLAKSFVPDIEQTDSFNRLSTPVFQSDAVEVTQEQQPPIQRSSNMQEPESELQHTAALVETEGDSANQSVSNLRGQMADESVSEETVPNLGNLQLDSIVAVPPARSEPVTPPPSNAKNEYSGIELGNIEPDSFAANEISLSSIQRQRVENESSRTQQDVSLISTESIARNTQTVQKENFALNPNNGSHLESMIEEQPIFQSEFSRSTMNGEQNGHPYIENTDVTLPTLPIQRQPLQTVADTPSMQNESGIESINKPQSEVSEAIQPKIDTDELARKVYAQIRRKLATERERLR